jgi:hypothetical protein
MHAQKHFDRYKDHIILWRIQQLGPLLPAPT